MGPVAARNAVGIFRMLEASLRKQHDGSRSDMHFLASRSLESCDRHPRRRHHLWCPMQSVLKAVRKRKERNGEGKLRGDADQTLTTFKDSMALALMMPCR